MGDDFFFAASEMTIISLLVKLLIFLSIYDKLYSGGGKICEYYVLTNECC